MVFLLIWILFGIGCAICASNKNRSVPGWFILGMLLGPFGLLFIFLLEPAESSPKIGSWGWGFTVLIVIILAICFHYAYPPDQSQPLVPKQHLSEEPPPSPQVLKERKEADLKLSQEAVQKKSKTEHRSYIGKWKVEKTMPPYGQKWENSKYPSTFQILPNGKLVILMPPNPLITGTWKVLDDGRLQLSQEEQDGEPFQKPSIMLLKLENGKLSKPARPYKNDNEKAEYGLILIKVGK